MLRKSYTRYWQQDKTIPESMNSSRLCNYKKRSWKTFYSQILQYTEKIELNETLSAIFFYNVETKQDDMDIQNHLQIPLL